MAPRRLGVSAALVLAILGPSAWLAWSRTRRAPGETDALEVLDRLVRGEEWFRAEEVLDRDRDGRGEYGYLQQLSAEGFIDSSLGDSARENKGLGRREGYRFRLHLPVAGGSWRGESHPLPAFEPADADAQEDDWICFAWPDGRGPALRAGPRGIARLEASPWRGGFGPDPGAEAEEWTEPGDR